MYIGSNAQFTKESTMATLLCRECGNEIQIDDNGISNHLDDGFIDHEQDADHVAIADESE